MKDKFSILFLLAVLALGVFIGYSVKPDPIKTGEEMVVKKDTAKAKNFSSGNFIQAESKTFTINENRIAELKKELKEAKGYKTRYLEVLKEMESISVNQPEDNIPDVRFTSAAMDTAIISLDSLYTNDQGLIEIIDTTRLDVTYYGEPFDFFDFNLKRSTEVISESITKKIYLKQPDNWLSRFHLGMGLGVDKNLTLNYQIGIYYKLW